MCMSYDLNLEHGQLKSHYQLYKSRSKQYTEHNQEETAFNSQQNKSKQYKKCENKT